MDVSLSMDWEEQATRIFLAFSVASACIILLRRPWRAVFGAGATYPLWLAMPLAVVVASLPSIQPDAFISIAAHLRHAAIPAALNTHNQPSGYVPAIYLVAAWFFGVCATVAWFGFAQWRYVRGLHGGSAWRPHAGIPVFFAPASDHGPAQLGIFRRRIILPADFATRFTATEQRLVLAHETTHARRYDCAWTALAHAFVVLFWFHPMAWWALRAFRADQELACDASVIRRHPRSRRTYAEALLKNHGTTLLPVGCSWFTTHPLTERIAMLNASPTRARHRMAAFVMPIALAGITLSAWSATPPAVTGKPVYQVKADIAANDGNDAHVILCANENTPASVRPAAKDGAPAWAITFTVVPAPQPGMLDVTIDSATERGDHRVSSRQILRGKTNEAMAVRYGDGADNGLRSIDVVPTTGCPAAGEAHT